MELSAQQENEIYMNKILNLKHLMINYVKYANCILVFMSNELTECACIYIVQCNVHRAPHNTCLKHFFFFFLSFFVERLVFERCVYCAFVRSFLFCFFVLVLLTNFLMFHRFMPVEYSLLQKCMFGFFFKKNFVFVSDSYRC